MVLVDLTHPERAGLSGCAVTDGDHAVRAESGEVLPELALQPGRLLTALCEIAKGQGMDSINRSATRAGRLNRTRAALGRNGLTQDAATAVMGTNEQ